MASEFDDDLPRRFPRSVFDRGTEPDVRFTLANERTFLAWTRTALALIAGGVALEVLGLDLHPGLRIVSSLLLIATGVVVSAVSWFDWMRAERALREQRPLPHSALGTTLAVTVSVIGVLVALSIGLR